MAVDGYKGPPRATAVRAKAWFDETTDVPPDFREILEKYSSISAEGLERHVIDLVRIHALSTREICFH